MLWLKRFDPRRWEEIPAEIAEESRHFGLWSRLMIILSGLFLLSTASFAVEFFLFQDDLMFRRLFQNNTIILGTSFAVVAGVLMCAWWTRYLAYGLFVLGLANIIICSQVRLQGVGEAAQHDFFLFSTLALTLVRDLPLCLYLTASRRARMTLEHHRLNLG
jgi:cytochrome c oxidase subunit IV